MKKLGKMMLLSVMMIFVMLITGCGADKFAGKWIYQEENGGVQELEIEKNGDKNGYIIQETRYYYDIKQSMQNEKEYNEYININPFERVKKQKERVIPIYDYECIWKKSFNKNTAQEENNRLIVDGKLGTQVYAYIEKDDTLQIKNIVYRKEKDNDLENMKKAIQERIKNKYEEKYNNETQSKVDKFFQAKLGNITFTDEDTDN